MGLEERRGVYEAVGNESIAKFVAIPFCFVLIPFGARLGGGRWLCRFSIRRLAFKSKQLVEISDVPKLWNGMCRLVRRKETWYQLQFRTLMDSGE